MISIIEAYRLIFGRGELRSGTVIDMGEHGRAGGVNTGQGFKFVDDVKHAVQTDAATTSNVTYIGKAKIGSATSSTVWQIMKVDETTTDVTVITWADGNDNFDNIWDNRASLSYS